jgi:hypothetical protein
MSAGADRKSMSDAGKTLSLTDSLIAAVARENDATVLTSNIKDYPMKDVRVMSLRQKTRDTGLFLLVSGDEALGACSSKINRGS